MLNIFSVVRGQPCLYVVGALKYLFEAIRGQGERALLLLTMKENLKIYLLDCDTWTYHVTGFFLAKTEKLISQLPNGKGKNILSGKQIIWIQQGAISKTGRKALTLDQVLWSDSESSTWGHSVGAPPAVY